MKLTVKQKRNIQNLDTETTIELLHECAERLGLVTVSEYCKIMNRKKRVTYLDIENEKIKTVTFGGVIYCVING